MASPGKSCWFGDVQNVFLAASSILERLHSESRNEGLENDFSFQLGLWKSKTTKRMVPNLGWFKFPTTKTVFGENLFF